MKKIPPHLPLFLALFLVSAGTGAGAGHDYRDALLKAILFFEGQRSGFLPEDQRMTWRGHSGLGDGWTHRTDLTGGYYDAGDNVKFGFPMAFTATMMAWSVIEFGEEMPRNELRNALVAIRWATDYLLKTVSQLPHRIFVQVGDPSLDHNCWERPEDMDTTRTVYAIDAPNPASDVAGETAAALAASSMAFRSSDPGYSETLLRNAIRAFQYADNYRGAYTDNDHVRQGACPYYCNFDGYQDELLWGGAWLRRATGEEDFLNYIQNNAKTFGAEYNINEFGWENKHAGLNVLVAKEVLEGSTESLYTYKVSAESFICSLIPESPSSQYIKYSPGGLIYRPGGSNLQHATSISFLLLVYANYLSRSSKTLNCAPTHNNNNNNNYININNIKNNFNINNNDADVIISSTSSSGTLSNITASTLRRIAKRQVDYILGHNPMGMSYMVGYSDYYPQRIHHRGSSLPSIKHHPQFIACKEGSFYFNSSNPNPNVLVGAVVGGPEDDDVYEDDRADFRKSEPTTYINAPFVGVLAYFAANPNP